MNNVQLAHPDREQLTAFAQGRLADAELVAIHAHLSECPACREQVETTGDDTLVALLRSADTAPNTQAHEAPAEVATVAAVKPAAPTLPSELAQHSRYRVQELLGVGGMGAVYKAEHLLLERPVALKLINHSLTSDRAMVERFRREVKTAGQLKHPNIVLAYDAEQAGDSHFLVMEYVEGKSLARVVAEEGPLPVRQASNYIRQAALGLQYAHERGMVHRDIKPHNLMLTHDGHVKILDFGLARFAMESAPSPLAVLPSPASSLTQVGIVMGTPDYIAPEQARDAHTADIRADIYSLGCTLYDLLAGHAPFAGGTVMSKVMAHIERTPTPLNQVRSDVPADLARVVERMMAKDPARRYQTPAAVATALARFASPPVRSRGRSVRWLAAALLLLAVLSLPALLFAPTIYRIITNRGELIVEVDDPMVEVVLKAAGIEIQDRVTNSTYHVKLGPNDVKAGDYQMQVKDPRGGTELFTTLFTITRNGKTPVKVTFAPKREVPDRNVAHGEAGRLISTFGTGFKPITTDGVTEDNGAWRINSATARLVRLYEAQPPLEECVVYYRAKMKSANLAGKAYLEMLARASTGGEFFSKGLHNPVQGTTDWTTVETPFILQKDERPDMWTLCVRLEAAGQVWIKDIELWQMPLPPELRRPSNLTPVGTKDGVVKRFTATDKPVSDRAKPDQKGWRIETGKTATIPLFVTKDFRDDNCMAIYRAQLKAAKLKGKAYLEMLVHLPGEPDDREYFSRGLANPISGTTDWASYETPFFFEKGQRPDRIRLNLVIEGSGTVWIRDIELLRGPLVK
jgi:hypothetical protein